MPRGRGSARTCGLARPDQARATHWPVVHGSDSLSETKRDRDSSAVTASSGSLCLQMGARRGHCQQELSVRRGEAEGPGERGRERTVQTPKSQSRPTRLFPAPAHGGPRLFRPDSLGLGRRLCPLRSLRGLCVYGGSCRRRRGRRWRPRGAGVRSRAPRRETSVTDARSELGRGDRKGRTESLRNSTNSAEKKRCTPHC